MVIFHSYVSHNQIVISMVISSVQTSSDTFALGERDIFIVILIIFDAETKVSSILRARQDRQDAWETWDL